MKSKFFYIVLVVFALAALLVTPVFALSLYQVDTPTSDVQLYVIGLASTAIVYVVSLVAIRFPKIKLTREVISIFIYIVALGLSFYFGGFVFPSFPAWNDPVTFVTALLAYISAFLIALAAPVSLATLFYNLLFKRVFDALAVKAGLIKKPEPTPALQAKK